MPKIRFISLLFLTWSAAFFFLPDFRMAFQTLTPFASSDAPWAKEWLLSDRKFSSKGLQDSARRAIHDRDARTLAFVALHLGTHNNDCNKPTRP